MGHIEATRYLDATPEALWATVSDTYTWDKWFSIHEKWLEEPPAQLTEGAKLVAKVVMLGMANKIDWTVGELSAPNALRLAGTGMAGVKVDFRFGIEPDGDGSTFTVAGDFEGALLKGALAKAVEKDGEKQLDTTLERLSALAATAA